MAERIVCWFSCGAASAVATKLMIAENAGRLPLVIAYTEVINEHPDNRRFISDCEKWFGQSVVILRNEKYNADIREVFRKRKFIKSQHGAPCTNLLKRQMRVHFDEEGDQQIFGFTAEETERANRMVSRNTFPDVRFPLIEKGLKKPDCLAMIDRAGIEIPAMYKLGYRNNNCIGCVKGGIGYWNKIRVDFPIQFQEMAQIEREIGHTVLKDKDGGIYLDELAPERGQQDAEPDIECSFFCHMAEQELTHG